VYVFEAAETRSPLLAYMAARQREVARVRTWMPPDVSQPAAYLYRVRLRSVDR
jgi:hypothetical protein